jgi:prepilin-type N-terminal cleavage/methylation domain-containing protein
VKKGFTLLEVLVASVLMGMLVTILTMIFNQSAIAWRTGKAGVSDMAEIERNMSRIHRMADNVLPYTGSRTYCVTSPWDDADGGDNLRLYPRGICTPGDLRNGVDSVSGNFGGNDAGKSSWQRAIGGSASANGGKMYVVGVRSAGPDRFFDTEDDITTWPDEIE